MSTQKIKIPDIGADSAEVIEILVEVGETISAEQSIATLESDKASVEVPAPADGVVKAIHINVGDDVAEGADLIDLEVAGSEEAAPTDAEPETKSEPESVSEPVASAAEPAATTVQSEEVREYTVPDIGSDEAEVIDVPVSVGDSVEEGDTIVEAESDKAALEVPAEASGIIEAISVKVGDKISQGSPLVSLKVISEAPGEAEESEPAAQTTPGPDPVGEQPAAPAESVSAEQTYQVPDIGSDSAEIIDVSVSVGDEIQEGDTIVEAESDKAALEVPAEVSGVVVALHVSIGDKISMGDDLVTLKTETVVESAPAASEPAPAAAAPAAKPAAPQKPAPAAAAPASSAGRSGGTSHAGPAVRKLARQLGVDLSAISGSGPRGRVLKDDLHSYVKNKLAAGGGGATAGGGLPEIPATDWSQFGEISVEPMSRIHKVTAANMVRNWLNVPHVTQFDDADVTDLEDYRAMLKHEAGARGIKMTPLAFLLKASANALQKNPKFNSSLHENGNDLVLRKYVHIGVAVDTPRGLMVPVIRDVDQKDIWQLAKEVAEFAGSARDGKLKPADMQGASFTISSLGPMGGNGFTPIVNAPQVGILGVSNTSVKPVWNGTEFVPRKMMPLALSYDHRAINGADAGQFMIYLVSQLSSAANMWDYHAEG